MKSPERCLKSDPTISDLDMPEKIPDQAFDMPTCLNFFFERFMLLLTICSQLALNKMRNKIPFSW